MTDPFIGEIRAFPYFFTPKGWAACNGQLLPIQGNTALFAILGTAYGGNGSTTFAVPDLQNRVPLCWGQGPGLSPYSRGQAKGVDFVTLRTAEMPQHSHDFNASGELANERQPAGQVFAQGDGISAFAPVQEPTYLNPQVLSSSGNNAPHENRMPFMTFHFCMAMQGDYPTSPEADA
jgi:microcystin-dependent protein